MTFWNRIRIILGAEICEHCGSDDIVQQGYEEQNHKHVCRKCHEVTYVD